jgi:8-oxo-dGTP pyrophosphatase MutT (NUDIX family)
MQIAADGDQHAVHANGGDWLTAWHPPQAAPEGQPHGACGFCVTDDGGVILISNDGDRWDWPGGRPEKHETWEQTFRREMLEETCSVVGDARLLGFCRSTCLAGPEAGLVLVRSIWRGEVALLPWEPCFEIAHRRIVPAADVLAAMRIDPGWEPVFRRAAREAGLI